MKVPSRRSEESASSGSVAHRKARAARKMRRFTDNHQVLYTDKKTGEVLEVTVVKVYFDDPPPYYTVQMLALGEGLGT